MRLIDADALCDMCIIQTGSSRCYSCTIFDAPNIDAVPVVRCKDCKMRYPKDWKHCTLTGIPVEDNDFCSYGERKDNADD